MYLEHHGIKGQKWGIRRYQNYDGSYTQAGLKRYNKAIDDYNLAKEKGDKVAMQKAKSDANKYYKKLKTDKADAVLYGGLALTAAQGALYVKNNWENKRLRAYYAH